MIASQLMSRRMNRTKRANQVKLRFGGSRTITNRRRNRRNWANQGLEINKADGGRKNNVQTGAFRTLTVDTYGRIVLVKEQDGYSPRFQLAVENFTASYNYLDIVTNLNLAPEFIQWKSNSIKYKVLSVSFTFNYTRVPEGNDKIAKLLLWFDTDLAEVKAPLLESTVMKLDMSKTGTKNYGIVLNKRNMKPEHIDWFNSEDSYNGLIYLNIGSQDINYLNNENVLTQLLGTFKISVDIALVLKDLAYNNNRKVLLKSKLGGIKEDALADRIKQLSIEEKENEKVEKSFEWIKEEEDEE
jgi:hypothetical protein